jgi:hypothetical protein
MRSWEGRGMSVEVFLEYLLAHQPTAQLARQLAEVYATRTRIEHQSVAVGGVRQ